MQSPLALLVFIGSVKIGWLKVNGSKVEVIYRLAPLTKQHAPETVQDISERLKSA